MDKWKLLGMSGVEVKLGNHRGTNADKVLEANHDGAGIRSAGQAQMEMGASGLLGRARD